MDGDPGLALREGRVEGAYGLDPDLHVLPLELAHALAVAVPQAVQLAVVEGDQGPVVQGEVDVALDEGVQERVRGAAPGGAALGDAQLPAYQQALADADEQLGEHRVLAGEVTVEAGAADTDRRPYLVDPDTVEAALGEEAGGLPEDLLAAGGSRDTCGGMSAHGDSF